MEVSKWPAWHLTPTEQQPSCLGLRPLLFNETAVCAFTAPPNTRQQSLLTFGVWNLVVQAVCIPKPFTPHTVVIPGAKCLFARLRRLQCIFIILARRPYSPILRRLQVDAAQISPLKLELGWWSILW